MENSTAFDLNRAIQSWRAQLSQSPAFQREDLDELESHLREAMAAFEARGLSLEEAFLLAHGRLGSTPSLAAEFGRVNRSAVWFDRLFWMVIGYQVWLFVYGLTGLVTQSALFLGVNGAGYDFRAHGYAVPVTLMTLVQLAGFTGSLALCGWLFHRKGPWLGRWLERLLQRRTTWVLTCGMVYALCFAIFVAGVLIRSLLMRSVGPENLGALSATLGFSSVFTGVVTAAVFICLTLVLGRKRFRLTGAWG